MALDINTLRDVFFADLRSPEIELGGLILTSGMTNSIFYTIVAIAIDQDTTNFGVQDSDGEAVANDDGPLRPGHYLIVSDQPATPSTKAFFTRALSNSTGTLLESFKNQVRDRDRRCVITKVEASLGPLYNHWRSFESAHIVPIAYSSEWRRRGFPNLVTIPPPPPHESDSINSVQNGLLMQSSVHQLFDSYDFSILPEADYKIISFKPDFLGIAGQHLDRQLLDDARRPPDALLSWHFEQAVYANVREGGEPNLDFDFPPGSDMMGEILGGPKGAERMQFELFTRLGGSHILED
ncbi:hypothetical protein SBRCBS47491_009571 [Sporothrix bragantina]|uniref:HNH nuclease domain-containing protein n=1 Tax=Sporothrix bragantina TaxID=671064 RepID=A0ABP0CVR7_9PEZI